MNKSNSMSNMTTATAATASAANSLSMAASTTTSLTTAASLSSMFAPTPGGLVAAADIQAQFELSVELRRFVNIDLFQRGYYQIRVAVRVGNKQVLNKVSIKLENAKSNMNLSDVMFASCINDDFAISKTFLILYRNEEVILDDHFIFKVDAMVNAFNLVESFDKLDLQLSIELWFTENDFIPIQQQIAASSVVTTSTPSATTTSTTVNNSQTTTTPTATSSSSSTMQLLCARLYKVHFDPRQGVHLQMPVIFDYFHLSSVLVTLHCFLLTLLPPVLVGPNTRNSTLAAILFGKDLAQFQSAAEITPPLMRRAVHLHQQICHLLLTSYENLQDHIMSATSYLNEYERKKISLEFVNCREKLDKLTQIIQGCYEAEALDDMANRHVAQCSAENIMLWCLYLEHFSLNQTTAPYLASEYHNKRLKRFSESFFVKDVPRKNIQDYEMSDSYIGLNDMIRQTAYYQQIPELIVACDDLDGTAKNLPIIFEDIYVHSAACSSGSSTSTSRSISSATFSQPAVLKDPHSTVSNLSSPLLHQNGGNLFNSFNSKTSSSHHWSSLSSRLDTKSSSGESTTSSGLAAKANKFVSKKLHKKSNNEDIFALAEKSSITLTSYKKTDNYFSDSPANSVDSSPSTPPIIQLPMSVPLAQKQQSTTAPSTEGPNSANVSLRRSLHVKSASHKEYLLHRQQSQKAMAVLTAKKEPKEDIPTSIAEQIIPPAVDDPVAAVAEAAAPTDCSLKSRALYESFRGKLNTLERPGRVRRSLNNSVSSNGGGSAQKCSSQPGANSAAAASAAAAVSSSAAAASCDGQTPPPRTDSSSSTGSKKHHHHHHHHHHHNHHHHHRHGSTRHGSIDAGVGGSVETPSAAASITPALGTLSLVASAASAPPVVQKLDSVKRPQQLSIQTDPNSLSCILNEHVYRFVIAREEIKRALSLKYHGNIYSEYSTLFCTTPYFYPDLMPKFALLPASTHPPSTAAAAAAASQSTSAPTATNAASSTKNGRGSSFMSSIRSKSKLFKLFKKSTDSNTSKEEPATTPASTAQTSYHHEKGGSETRASSPSTESNSSSVSGESDVDGGSASDNDEILEDSDEKLHLVICVHGLDGNSGDLRLLRTYLELALPGARMDFLMSEQNQDSTFEDIEMMTLHLIKEIKDYVDTFGIEPGRISFIGHSLGNLIIRSTVSHPDFAPFAPKLYTYLSLSGPHLGTLYNSNNLVNMGMWFMQKWKKSGSLLQLSLKDNSEPYKTFLYKLSRKPTFELFKNVLLVASPQDRYVPFHSAHVQSCKAASKDSSFGPIYREMVNNILKPIQENPQCTFVRYSAFYTLPSDTSNFIGRAAHIAVLDSELFVEKLILVSVAKYFR